MEETCGTIQTQDTYERIKKTHDKKTLHKVQTQIKAHKKKKTKVIHNNTYTQHYA